MSSHHAAADSEVRRLLARAFGRLDHGDATARACGRGVLGHVALLLVTQVGRGDPRDPRDRVARPSLQRELWAALAAWCALTPAAIPSDARHSHRRIFSGWLPIAPRLDMSVAAGLGAHDLAYRKREHQSRRPAKSARRGRGRAADAALRMKNICTCAGEGGR